MSALTLPPVSGADVVPVILDPESGEIMRRQTAGLLVTLHWFSGRVIVRVDDAGEIAQACVPADRAMDAFTHPFLYV